MYVSDYACLQIVQTTDGAHERRPHRNNDWRRHFDCWVLAPHYDFLGCFQRAFVGPGEHCDAVGIAY
jgi:hypothetical protein